MIWDTRAEKYAPQPEDMEPGDLWEAWDGVYWMDGSRCVRAAEEQEGWRDEFRGNLNGRKNP